MATSRLHELSTHGVSVWMDSLSREMLETGELARLMADDAVVGGERRDGYDQEQCGHGGTKHGFLLRRVEGCGIAES